MVFFLLIKDPFYNAFYMYFRLMFCQEKITLLSFCVNQPEEIY